LVGYNNTKFLAGARCQIWPRWYTIVLLRMKTNIGSRWQTSEGAKLASEVLRYLADGASLHALGLAEHEGRIDLRGLRAADVRKVELPQQSFRSVRKLEGQLEFRNVHWEGLDLSDAQLSHFRFFNSLMANCRFDRSQCEDWRLWATNVIQSSFVSANLRAAVLGPWYEGRGNTYKFVNFSQADMRKLVSPAATYEDCDFSNARLESIDFQSSSFIRCRFAGELREVMFYDHGFKTGKPDPNPMEDVDFSKAKLRWVAFRRLDLERVRLPHDEDHLIVMNYPCVLKNAFEKLANARERHEIELRGLLKNYLKWVGSNQTIGIFSRLDFAEAWGKAGEEFAVNLLCRAESECANEAGRPN
jgi:uncharacterized protein YjbI with pentapeptide repeats